MKRINNYISEKLHINKNVKVYHNEKVLVLQSIQVSSLFSNCYDLSQYVFGLEKFYEDNPTCNKFIFSYSESHNGQSYPVSKTFENGKLTISKVDDELFKQVKIFVQCFKYASTKSNNIISNLIHYYKDIQKDNMRYIMFDGDNKIVHKYNFLYLFYSYKKDAIQLHLSDTDYNKLLNDGFFD